MGGILNSLIGYVDSSIQMLSGDYASDQPGSRFCQTMELKRAPALSLTNAMDFRKFMHITLKDEFIPIAAYNELFTKDATVMDIVLDPCSGDYYEGRRSTRATPTGLFNDIKNNYMSVIPRALCIENGLIYHLLYGILFSCDMSPLFFIGIDPHTSDIAFCLNSSVYTSDRLMEKALKNNIPKLLEYAESEYECHTFKMVVKDFSYMVRNPQEPSSGSIKEITRNAKAFMEFNRTSIENDLQTRLDV